MVEKCIICDDAAQGWVGDRPWHAGHYCSLCAMDCEWTAYWLRHVAPRPLSASKAQWLARRARGRQTTPLRLTEPRLPGMDD